MKEWDEPEETIEEPKEDSGGTAFVIWRRKFLKNVEAALQTLRNVCRIAGVPAKIEITDSKVIVDINLTKSKLLKAFKAR